MEDRRSRCSPAVCGRGCFDRRNARCTGRSAFRSRGGAPRRSGAARCRLFPAYGRAPRQFAQGRRRRAFVSGRARYQPVSFAPDISRKSSRRPFICGIAPRSWSHDRPNRPQPQICCPGEDRSTQCTGVARPTRRSRLRPASVPRRIHRMVRAAVLAACLRRHLRLHVLALRLRPDFLGLCLRRCLQQHRLALWRFGREHRSARWSAAADPRPSRHARRAGARDRAVLRRSHAWPHRLADRANRADGGADAGAAISAPPAQDCLGQCRRGVVRSPGRWCRSEADRPRPPATSCLPERPTRTSARSIADRSR